MATPDELDEVCHRGKLYTDLQKACQHGRLDANEEGTNKSQLATPSTNLSRLLSDTDSQKGRPKGALHIQGRMTLESVTQAHREGVGGFVTQPKPAPASWR